MKVFMDLKWFFKQEKRPYMVGILLLIVVAMLELLPPKIIGIIVDGIKEGTLTGSQLLTWMIVLTVTGISMYVFRYFWRAMISAPLISLRDSCGTCCILILRKCRKPFIKRKELGI
jgi:ATP-binding cassette, subfamily B, multidrug efflux pump